jgi:hypothetical protein
MAAATKNPEATEKNTTSKLKIGKVEKLDEPLRGRGFSAEVIAVRAELEACLTDRQGRSFDDVSEDEKEEYARIVRSAGSMRGKDEIKVTTRYVRSTNKLLWGPKEVMDELSKK